MVRQDDDACTLVRKLDGLPLALTTAGAYLYQVSTSFAGYLGLYNASWFRLHQKTPELLSYEDRALYSTWDISLDRVKQQSSLAFKLLQLWAYFDNQDVWFELLQECQQDSPEWFSQLTEDQLSFDEAVRVLCEHALIEADVTFQDDSEESLGYSMHSCVHSWANHVVNEDWDVNIAKLVLNCVGLHVPDHRRPRYWIVEQRLVGHANRCREFMSTKLLGQNEESCFEAVNNLGALYADLGRLDEAEKMYQRALQGKEKAWGLEHTSTLETVNNLGNLYKNLGRLDEAEKMYSR
jgi:tetratricopeptide (TPR) repeat protein